MKRLLSYLFTERRSKSFKNKKTAQYYAKSLITIGASIFIIAIKNMSEISIFSYEQVVLSSFILLIGIDMLLTGLYTLDRNID